MATDNWSRDLFAFFPTVGDTGEKAVGITAAAFNPGADDAHAKSVVLEHYDATGLGTFVW